MGGVIVSETRTRQVSSQQVGGAERTSDKAVAGGLGQVRQLLAEGTVPRLCVDKPRGTTGKWDRPRNPGFQHRDIKSQNLWKTCGGWGGKRNSQPHRRVHWRDPQGPRTYTNPLTWESAPEGPNLPVGSRASDWKPAERPASNIVPSQTPPPHTVPQCSNLGCPALANS